MQKKMLRVLTDRPLVPDTSPNIRSEVSRNSPNALFGVAQYAQDQFLRSAEKHEIPFQKSTERTQGLKLQVVRFNAASSGLLRLVEDRGDAIASFINELAASDAQITIGTSHKRNFGLVAISIKPNGGVPITLLDSLAVVGDASPDELPDLGDDQIVGEFGILVVKDNEATNNYGLAVGATDIAGQPVETVSLNESAALYSTYMMTRTLAIVGQRIDSPSFES